jgi:Uma2 family endonuclease
MDPRAGPPRAPADRDQFVTLRLDWSEFMAFLELKGEASVPRITYLDGALELMSPSTTHEGGKKLLARLIEHYAFVAGLHLEGYGSWTLKDEVAKVGVEPDECYVRDGLADRVPDLAVEVVHTHGGLSKLEAYRRLGVREVWYWADQRLQVFVLEGAGYVVAESSAVLPELDLGLLSTCMTQPSQRAALERLAAALRTTRSGSDEP